MLTKAQQARDKGMKRALNHADAIDPRWKDRVYTRLVKFAKSHYRFTSEEFRHATKLPMPVPKALGPLFRQCAKEGYIGKAGFGVSRDRHLSPTVMWKSKVYAR